MKKRALVTGATGFVGSRLVFKLLLEGYDVDVLVRKASNLGELCPVVEQLTVHVHDGSTEAMFLLMEKAKPSIVFHVASMAQAEHQAHNLLPLVNSNITIGTQLVEAMLNSGCNLLVNTGTFWQHYENKDYSPVCLYAATKQAFEAILQYYVEAKSLKVITLKLFDNYGPKDPRPKLLQLLRNTAKSQEPLAMSHGEQLIDLVYIDDVINAYVLAAERLLSRQVREHEVYAVSSGKPIKVKELVELFEKITSTKLPIQWGARPYKNREVFEPWNSGQLLPGWVCQTSLLQGIESTVFREKRRL